MVRLAWECRGAIIRKAPPYSADQNAVEIGVAARPHSSAAPRPHSSTAPRALTALLPRALTALLPPARSQLCCPPRPHTSAALNQPGPYDTAETIASVSVL